MNNKIATMGEAPPSYFETIRLMEESYKSEVHQVGGMLKTQAVDEIRCKCGSITFAKKSRLGYLYRSCPNQVMTINGKYEGGCNFWTRVDSFAFGKYKDQSFGDVLKKDKKYLVWCRENLAKKDHPLLFNFLENM